MPFPFFSFSFFLDGLSAISISFFKMNVIQPDRQRTKKGVWDWEGGDFFGANRRLFIMIFLGEGGEGGVLSSLSPGLVNW